jgi:hypothetical protein
MKLKYGMKRVRVQLNPDIFQKKEKNTNKLATKEGFILFQKRSNLYISTGTNN